MTAFLFILGLVLLVAGAELLVRGASTLAARLGLSPLMIGLTVVAFGTSSPELAVSLKAALGGSASVDLVLGNVVGSNILNVLVVLGLAALITPLVVTRLLVRVDVPIMIGVSILLVLLSLDGRIGRLDGLLLTLGMLAYSAMAYRLGKADERPEAAPLTPADAHPPAPSRGWLIPLLTTLTGLALLVLGSHWLVQGAMALAQRLGVSQMVIGLTVVAIGTSLPEIATAIMATLRGQRDIAVGGVVGSNIANILGVLGPSAVVAGGGISVPAILFQLDYPLLLVAAAACLPVFFTEHTITRLEGLGMLVLYVLYTCLLVLHTTQHAAFGSSRRILFLLVIPAMALPLLVQAWRQREPSH
jgi:cation:H+ antiporter